MWVSEHHWTVDPVPVPGSQLVSLHFDHSRLTPAHIEACGIALPASIVRSVPRRQAEFIAGRLCAREALRVLTGLASIPAIGPDRAPQWPEGVCGSISHCGDIAMAVVAPLDSTACVGIDIEHRLDERKAHELHEQILISRERERFLRLPTEQRGWLLSLTFSLKESLYKALYPLTGTHFYFEDAELLEHSNDGKACLRLHKHLNETFTHGSLIEGGFHVQGQHILTWVSLPATHSQA
ncbi:4'-phosphopantetheinyl transferase superfamily protein [Pseudomonas sp. ABC1]|uniref:4'-phosphopantetheinyl transferase family protein n=1 Tax=Pseudomonas sp. ABC1 TaxID=2748080 RepID=UPI0015C2DDF9|nr:4'-phosphopantetheinyl transferase superfamily protein [Pseudomonas sp. ABC1]QLF91919.1 4'-phosphopantetheinyl transferase superfamily protein [Pseudomonas sp. ABC1]